MTTDNIDSVLWLQKNDLAAWLHVDHALIAFIECNHLWHSDNINYFPRPQVTICHCWTIVGCCLPYNSPLDVKFCVFIFHFPKIVAQFDDRQHNNNQLQNSWRQHVLSNISTEAKHIASKLELDNRISIEATSEAFKAIKDHKENFPDNITCHLINPAQSELGKGNKQILERINQQVTTNNKLIQWKNTNAVLSWSTTSLTTASTFLLNS